MTPTALPYSKEVVLIGGGHSHALLLRAWGMRPVAGARLTLINPAPSAPYTGMLPGFVAGHYAREALEIDLVRLARHAGARLILGVVDGIDRDGKRISISGRPDIGYDIASLDIGITSEMPELKGFSEFGVPAKPLGPFAARWSSFLETSKAKNVAVLGGGVGGVELALAMKHRLTSCGRSDSVTVIEATNALAGVAGPARARLIDHLARKDIRLIETARAAEVSADGITLDNGENVLAGLVVGAAGARPYEWLQSTGLELKDGFVVVDGTLRSRADPTIYAAGDCAHLSHAPRPKAGVFAVRAAPLLTHNIRADLTGRARKRFRPQSRYLKLISLGGKTALTDKWGVALEGDWVWRWKDKIDQRFMDRLTHLPEMDVPWPRDRVVAQDTDLAKPLCGGCGAKVGGATLAAALAKSVDPSGTGDTSGPGDDAALLKMGPTQQVISTDHLRGFWPDPYVMAKITAVHALGDIWAMGATPQAMLPQIILPRMSDRLQASWLEEIMQAAREVADDAGARIVGGHTTLGTELTLGFTVTGLLENKPVTLAGAQPGDAILLTRAIGSGTILAAEMAGQARGSDVTNALALMATPQADAARILAPQANAMTDVTGFGLAGHLARMANASGVTAELDIASIPLMEGALDHATRGIRSSIFAANRRDIDADVPDTPLGALLYDPQTSGGLLAAISPERAMACQKALNMSGHDARIVGRFLSRESVSVRAR